MKYLDLLFAKFSFVLFSLAILFCVCCTEGAWAAKKETFDIIYLRTKDFEKVLDYKEELETILDPHVKRKLKIVGWESGDYAVVYDGNLSARTVAKTLVKHAEMLSNTGFDEPYATKKQDFYNLYNVSYGMGRNLDSLKETYQLLYSCLGEEVKRDLVIEKTDYGNYILVYRLRGDEASTNAVAKKQSAILRAKKISTSISRENNNDVVYGESSLIDDGDADKPTFCKLPYSSDNSRALPKTTSLVVAKAPEPVSKKNDILLTSKVAPQAPPKVELTPVKPEATVNTTINSQHEALLVASTENTKVERAIEEYIGNLRSKGVIASDESTGWMVYDLESDRNLVGINADIEFQAASMIKPFVALAFFHKVREGKLRYDARSKRQMEAMIQRSSNTATNYIMRKAGGPEQCNVILKKYYSHIFKKTEIKEYIPANGRTYLNSATPADYVRFLRSLWNMDLPYGKEIRRVMALPGRDRLYYGTNIPRGTLVYNKTGTTAHLVGDMGILVTKTQKGEIYPYVIVGIIERRSKASDYGQWMVSRSRVIREVSTLVYEGLKKEHHLL
ncbi:MAG: class A beta-lactamase-related serine hydrolase [Proteobacteria bacterium]|nr:class A beta-lactamase-related serine hydrolase [Pseudomonadota bacterium]